MQANRRLGDQLAKAGLTMLILLFIQNMLKLPLLMFRNSSLFAVAQWAFPPLGETISMLVYLAAMGGTVVIGRHIFGCRPGFAFPMSRVRRDYFYPAVGAGLGVTMVGNLLATVATVLLGMLGFRSSQNTVTFDNGAAAGIISMLTVMLLPSILEEMLFRGVLLQSLRSYGHRLAVVVSSLLFALCHPTLPQAVNAFVVGLCLGLFTVRSGSLVPAMVIHFCYNMLACAVSLSGYFVPIQLVTPLVWAVILTIMTAGAYCCFLLRNRFGRVWWLPDDRRSATVPGEVFYTAVTCLPLVAATLLFALEICRNLY